MNYKLNYLRELESEAIFLLRELSAQFERPVILFSGGKDSIVVTHLAVKAFLPAKMPFPLLHVDTGHNFEETLAYRDELVRTYGLDLRVASVEKAIQEGELHEEKGPNASRNLLQTPVLLKALEEGRFDVAIGGARRDEEKARAKERFLSHRDEFGQWDPKNQRPELWSLYNGRKHTGEHFRAFPISNWTEMDVWTYIREENIPLPSLYFSHERPIIQRGDVLLADSPYIEPLETDVKSTARVRCRTIGDITCTGLWMSEAMDIPSIIEEITLSIHTERGARLDDARSDSAMEDRKKEGYF
jgi:sulfate adenylyltransferase subunit 2